MVMESQNNLGWKELLEVSWCNPSDQRAKETKQQNLCSKAKPLQISSTTGI